MALHVHVATGASGYAVLFVKFFSKSVADSAATVIGAVGSFAEHFGKPPDKSIANFLMP